jgi:hypothetical protein
MLIGMVSIITSLLLCLPDIILGKLKIIQNAAGPYYNQGL